MKNIRVATNVVDNDGLSVKGKEKIFYLPVIRDNINNIPYVPYYDDI